MTFPVQKNKDFQLEALQSDSRQSKEPPFLLLSPELLSGIPLPLPLAQLLLPSVVSCIGAEEATEYNQPSQC